MVAQLHGMGVTLLNEDKTAFNFADNEAAINYVTKLSVPPTLPVPFRRTP